MQVPRGSTRDYGHETHLEIADYFAENLGDDRWHFSKAKHDPGSDKLFRTPRFNHRLETYLNALADAGLVLERAEEPRPTEEAAEQNPWLKRYRRHVPLILMIRTRKPAA